MDNTNLLLKTSYSDQVGIWYECESCKKQSFVPDFDENDTETDVFKYCPYCGKKIDKIINNG